MAPGTQLFDTKLYILSLECQWLTPTESEYRGFKIVDIVRTTTLVLIISTNYIFFCFSFLQSFFSIVGCHTLFSCKIYHTITIIYIYDIPCYQKTDITSILSLRRHHHRYKIWIGHFLGTRSVKFPHKDWASSIKYAT
jgi:hypothetical protein